MPYIRNKRTGETIFVPDQAGPPADPTFPYQGPQAAASVRKTEADIRATNAQTEATNRRTDFAERKLNADQQQRRRASQKEIEAVKTRALDLYHDIKTLDGVFTDLGDSWVAPGFGEVGSTAEMVKSIPFLGNAARDIDAQLGSLRSNIARSALQRMRAESPTGGAVGQQSDAERKMFEASRGPIEQKLKYPDFIKNLQTVRQRTLEELGRLAPKAAARLRNPPGGKRDDDDQDMAGGEFLGWED